MKPNTRATLSLVAIISATFFMTLNTTMMRVASPAMITAFDTTVDRISWVFNGYMLPYSLLMPLFGQIGDVLKRKRVFQFGLCTFIVGSALCALSPTLEILVAARAVKGIGAATIFPNALNLATALYPREQRGKVVGIWSSATAVGQVIGPSVGGLLIQYMGWRWIFWVNVPIGLAILTSQHFFPAATDETKRSAGSLRNCDFVGTLFLSLGVFSLLMVLWEVGSAGFGARTFLPLLLGLPAFIAFGRRERSAPIPILNVRLLTSALVAGMGVGACHMFVNQSAQFTLPLFLTNVKRFNPAQTGLMMLPSAMVRAVSSPMAGSLADKRGSRLPVVLGLFAVVLACSYFAFMNFSTALPMMGLFLLLYGFGDGMVWTANMTAVVKAAAPGKEGAATGVFNMVRFVAGIVGTTSVGLVMKAKTPAGPLDGYTVVPGYSHAYLLLLSVEVIGLLCAARLKPGATVDNEKRATAAL